MFWALKRKISDYLNRNRNMFLMAFTVFSVGIVAGAFGATRGETPGAEEITALSQNAIIMSSFLENLKFLTWIALWGLNVAGFPVILYLLYSKGAMLSASLYVVFAMKTANQIMLVITLLPYLLCTVASIIFMSQGSLGCSLELCGNVFLKKRTKNLSKGVCKMTAEFITASLFALLGGICEATFKVNIT